MDPLARMEKILAQLKAHPHGISGQELAGACGVPWAVIQKDLETIALAVENPIPIYCEADEAQNGEEAASWSPEAKWFLSTGLRETEPLHLTVAEALEALGLLNWVPSRRSSGAANLAARILDRLNLGSEESFRYLKGSLLPTKPIDDDLIMAARKAINRRHKVAFLFESRSYAGEPLGLVYYPRLRQWYLAARCEELVKLFSLSKIQVLRELPETFVYGDFSLRKWLELRWGVEYGEPMQVKVRFQNRAQTFAKVRKDVAYRQSKLTVAADGEAMILEDTVVGRNEFIKWILGFGSAAEVLEPLDLREEIRQRVRETLARYAET